MLNSNQFATVLAALRHYQATVPESARAEGLHFDDDDLEPLDDDAIDTLCEQLNRALFPGLAGLPPEQAQAALAWLIGRDTGVSSKTLFAALAGVADRARPSCHYDVPYDADDFGRCVRLLEAVPAWRPRLPEVAEMFPAWRPLVRDWDALTEAYNIHDRRREVSMRIQELTRPRPARAGGMGL